ncbi:hypothetical protein SGPA1_21991 [Streptomyces misionensis JCM 4497]
MTVAGAFARDRTGHHHDEQSARGIDAARRNYVGNAARS